MAITKSKKVEQLEKLKSQFQDSAGIAFVQFFGPEVTEVQGVRRDLRAKGMSYLVIKKTLMALAAKETGVASFSADDLEGSVAVIVSNNDALEPLVAIKDLKKQFFNKEAKTTKFDFSGCVFEGEFLGKEASENLAQTPSRETSLSKIVSALRFGPQGIHSALTFGLRNITLSLKEAEKFAKAS